MRDERFHLALCDDDRCPWKCRAATAWEAEREAEAHAARTGHSVGLYVDHRREGSR